MTMHFLGLQGAKTINTMPFKLTQRAVADLVSFNAMGAIHGPAGLGKTFAVDYAIQHVSRRQPAIRVQFDVEPTMKQVVQELLLALTGIPHEGTRYALSRDLAEVLAEEPRLIVVDEAQHLTYDCIEQLRDLWDKPNTTFALALVGGNGCWDVLSRHQMLVTRIYRHVPFSRMTSAEILAIIPGYHDLYVNARKEDILLIDDTFAHGTWRSWAAVTHTCVSLCQERGSTTLDEEVARFALGLLGAGTRTAA